MSKSGCEVIAAERERQLAALGWTPEHDDTHRYGELAITAACYAVEGTDAKCILADGGDAWPFGVCSDKRKQHDPIRRLVIAGALIAAEIDRLQRRAALRAATSPSEPK